MSGKKPIVAIVGRPNVGKSTLCNVLARERIAIVEDTPGITRDRITAEVSWSGREFTVIDTGGIEPDSKDILLSQMREQAVMAMEMADVIIFLTDVRQGLTDQDGKVADMLRRSAAPVVLAVNKVDAYEKQQLDVYEFYNLGLGDPLPISAANRQGLGELLDAVIACFKEGAGLGEEEDLRVKVAVIGKPNVGKSSLINKILGENRLVVSDIPGTTRDAIDTDFSRNGKDYVLIDTAGLRRKNKIKEDLEHYMILRAVGAIERADVAVLLIDAKEGVSEQDAKIAGLAHNQGKAVIIAVNKWDAVPKETMTAKRTEEKIRNILSFMPYAEVVFISALTGQRVSKLFDVIDMVAENHAMRIQTGVLNEILSEATAMKQPPQDKGRSLKIYYGTQVSVKPPTFVLFVNSKKLMHFSYERYLENQIRDTFGFRGTPIRIYTREKNRMPENI